MSVVLDPTGELEPAQRAPLARPKSIEGITVGLLDISKARGNIFLDRIDSRLQEGGVKTKRYMKPTFAKAAPVELLQTIASECDVVVEGLAD
jgi:hypothetical protein